MKSLNFRGAFVAVLIGVICYGLGVAPAKADLLVSSHDTSQILRYDQTTGASLGVFASGGGLFGPGEMTYGPDGNLYVGTADPNNPGVNGVIRYNGVTGAFINTFVALGSGGLESINGLTFGPDGNLYATSFASDTVKRYNGTTGAFLGNFTLAGTLFGPTDLAFGPDGNLYVGNFNTGDIRRFNGTTGAFINTFTSPSLGFGGNTYRFEFGPDGNLYVSDSTDNMVGTPPQHQGVSWNPPPGRRKAPARLFGVLVPRPNSPAPRARTDWG